MFECLQKGVKRLENQIEGNKEVEMQIPWINNKRV